MPTTKIINVLRNDTFEDVFNSFLDTQAKEVIFIMPRGSRLIRNSKYFEMIKDEAETNGKLISIMTSDPIISEYAENLGINLLNKDQGRSKSKHITQEEDSKEGIEESFDENIDTPVAVRSDFEISELSSYKTESDEFEDSEDEGDNDIEESEDVSPYSGTATLAIAKTKRTASKSKVPTKKTIPAKATDKEEAPTTKTEVVLEKDEKIEPLENIPTDTVSSSFNPLNPTSSLSIDNVLNSRQAPSSAENPYSNTQKQNIEISQDKEPIYDIKPKSNTDAMMNLSNLWLEKNNTQTKGELVLSAKNISTNNKRPMSKIFVIGLTMFILVAIVGGYTYMGTAEIIAKPQTQDVDIQLSIEAQNSTNIEPGSSAIAGLLITETAEVSENQDASSEREAAARSSGTITIYNTENKEQKLIATTRFESPEGKIFRIDKSVTIPAGTKNNPGTVKAKVLADKAGADFNIEPARFTLPGLKNTDKYTQVYAISESAFSGGGIGLSKIITQADIDKASSKSYAKLLETLKNSVNSKAEGLKIIDYNKANVLSEGSSVDADQVANSVKYTHNGSLSVIAFKEEDVINMALAKIGDKANNLAIKDGTLKIEYTDISYNIPDGKMTFNAKISATAYAVIDKETILKEILGMPEEAIKTYFANKKEVESVQIIFSPFWLRSVPSDKSKVNIKIEI